MHNEKKIDEDFYLIGSDDYRGHIFEGVYEIPHGISYNSYLLLDDVTVLFDTVDVSVEKEFFENLYYLLKGRKLNYIIIHHMEPDHSATLSQLLEKHPETIIITNEKIVKMIYQYFTFDKEPVFKIVNEGDVFKTQNHEYHFVMAPMVHWPEVMMTFDSSTKTLFSSDAFGTFGVLGGATYADEVDFFNNYLDEARRYYTNIVGKYGDQVQAILKKAATLPIERICPLHGPIFRKDIDHYLHYYNLWSQYEPEVAGVLIAFASVYGNTKNAVDILASSLYNKGVKCRVLDVSVTPVSELVSNAFIYSHIIFVSTTYNTGIFVKMEDFLHDLVNHNIQNRTVAFVENGTWAPASGSLMKALLKNCKNMNYINTTVTIHSSLKEDGLESIHELVNKICETMPQMAEFKDIVNSNALFDITYGLYVLTATVNKRENGCIINTAQLITDSPKQIMISVNHDNLTFEMIQSSKKFNLSILSKDVPYSLIQHFGFHSGKDTNKFEDFLDVARSNNGVMYLTKSVNAFISGEVVQSIDCGTHTIFIAKVTEAKVLSKDPSITYDDYFKWTKPQVVLPKVSEDTNAPKKKRYVCKICGYVYEGDELPDDFVCPICKHGAEDFELVE